MHFRVDAVSAIFRALAFWSFDPYTLSTTQAEVRVSLDTTSAESVGLPSGMLILKRTISATGVEPRIRHSARLSRKLYAAGFRLTSKLFPFGVRTDMYSCSSPLKMSS